VKKGQCQPYFVRDCLVLVLLDGFWVWWGGHTEVVVDFQGRRVAPWGVVLG
jgi:hypothetical protein